MVSRGKAATLMCSLSNSGILTHWRTTATPQHRRDRLQRCCASRASLIAAKDPQVIRSSTEVLWLARHTHCNASWSRTHRTRFMSWSIACIIWPTARLVTQVLSMCSWKLVVQPVRSHRKRCGTPNLFTELALGKISACPFDSVRDLKADVINALSSAGWPLRRDGNARRELPVDNRFLDTLPRAASDPKVGF